MKKICSKTKSSGNQQIWQCVLLSGIECYLTEKGEAF